MKHDRESLREMALRKFEERVDLIVDEISKVLQQPNPLTMLESEKGLHAETTRLADAIFEDVVRRAVADPDLNENAVGKQKKGASSSRAGRNEPESG
jgi:hypothetical protein